MQNARVKRYIASQVETAFLNKRLIANFPKMKLGSFETFEFDLF